jgi:cytosine/adenosine deaminase-related metal-dependent hydrolase
MFAISGDQARELSAVEGKSDYTTTVRRYALVVNDDVYDRAQVFSKRVSQHGVTAIVFSSFDIASTWLGVNPQRAAKLIQESDD